MKFHKDFKFFDSIEEAMRAAERFDAMHPGWNAHRAKVTEWTPNDPEREKARAICWTWYN